MAINARSSTLLLFGLAGLAAACSDGGNDAGIGPDAGIDAGTVDTGVDAGPPDTGVDAGPVLLVHFPLDGNADEATNPNVHGLGMMVSPAPDRHGVAGGALHFDSASSVVTISPVELTPPYSVSLWWSVDGHGPASPQCVGGEIASVLFAGYRFIVAEATAFDGISYAFLNDDPPPALIQTLETRTATTGWHHAVVIDAVDHGELWLDGQLSKTATISSADRHASFLVLGGHPVYPCGLQGSMDEVRVYTGILAPDAIRALYAP